ncbi:MAG TPA: hypothetical protein PLC17_06800, partial [Tenuifilaceae bacterium]|nr:hypothetical protein [Tenuifilaceae bacterium]
HPFGVCSTEDYWWWIYVGSGIFIISKSPQDIVALQTLGVDGGIMIILVFDTACCGSTHAGIGVGFPIIPDTPRHAVTLHVWGVDG